MIDNWAQILGLHHMVTTRPVTDSSARIWDILALVLYSGKRRAVYLYVSEKNSDQWFHHTSCVWSGSLATLSDLDSTCLISQRCGGVSETSWHYGRQVWKKHLTYSPHHIHTRQYQPCLIKKKKWKKHQWIVRVVVCKLAIGVLTGQDMTKTRDWDQGLWVWSGMWFSLLQYYNWSLCTGALTGLGLARELIQTTCSCVIVSVGL